MFYRKRIKALEERLQKLEKETDKEGFEFFNGLIIALNSCTQLEKHKTLRERVRLIEDFLKIDLKRGEKTEDKLVKKK